MNTTIFFFLRSDLEIGKSTRNELDQMSKDEIRQVFVELRRFYVTISRELIRNLPLENEIVRDLKFLIPSMRRNSSSRLKMLKSAGRVAQFNSPEQIDLLKAEWKIYRRENVCEEFCEKLENSIDDYWRLIFSLKDVEGREKFVVLSKLVKCLLALSHGNGDVERGFSENSFLFSDDRSTLSEKSINGLRSTRDAIRYFAQGNPHEVPITDELVQNVLSAHLRYKQDLKSIEQTKRKFHQLPDFIEQQNSTNFESKTKKIKTSFSLFH